MPLASPGHKLSGSSVLGTVLETSHYLVIPSIVAPCRAVLFHNLACFPHPFDRILPRRGMPWLAFCQNRTARWAHRFSRKELRACPSVRVPAPAGAEHPEPPRNHAPQQEKRRAEEQGPPGGPRAGPRRAAADGPTKPGSPPPPSRGGREAKRPGGRAGGATTSLPTSTEPPHIVAISLKRRNLWGARGPKPPHHGYQSGAYMSARYSMQAS